MREWVKKFESGGYELEGWIWPGDFVEHYVLTHKVRPTDEFLKWIGYDIQK
jgi:hypothetical protein